MNVSRLIQGCWQNPAIIAGLRSLFPCWLSAGANLSSLRPLPGSKWTSTSPGQHPGMEPSQARNRSDSTSAESLLCEQTKKVLCFGGPRG